MTRDHFKTVLVGGWYAFAVLFGQCFALLGGVIVWASITTTVAPEDRISAAVLLLVGVLILQIPVSAMRTGVRRVPRWMLFCTFVVNLLVGVSYLKPGTNPSPSVVVVLFWSLYTFVWFRRRIV